MKIVQAERLNPENSLKEYAIVLISCDKHERQQKWLPARKGHKSNRLIDAKISFYGTYVQLNEQVTLQNQDPVLNECAARLGVSLRCKQKIN